MVLGMVHDSSVCKLCLTVIFGELSLSCSWWPLSKIGVSYSNSHALAYRSSWFMMTSGSGFLSCDVVCISSIGCHGVKRCNLMGWRTWVLFIPSLRTKKNCYSARPFQRCKGLSFGNLWRELYFPGDLVQALERTQTVHRWVSQHCFFIIFMLCIWYWLACYSFGYRGKSFPFVWEHLPPFVNLA